MIGSPCRRSPCRARPTSAAPASSISRSSVETSSSSWPFCVALASSSDDMALEVGLDLADALRLAAERLGRMQIGIVIELLERLERHAQPLAVIEQAVVVIGNAPRPGIEVEAGVELAFLRRAAQLGIAVAAAQRPVAAAGAVVELEHLHLVAGLAQLQRRHHAGQPGAENQHRCALGIAVELDRPLVAGLRRVSEAGHRLVQRGTSGRQPDQLQQVTSAGTGRFIARHDEERNTPLANGRNRAKQQRHSLVTNRGVACDLRARLGCAIPQQKRSPPCWCTSRTGCVGTFPRLPRRATAPSWRQSFRLLDRYGFRPNMVFDIGVAYGTFELYDAFPKAFYHLIDPTSELLHHMRLLERQLNCRIHQVALGDRDGEVDIEIRPGHPGRDPARGHDRARGAAPRPRADEAPRPAGRRHRTAVALQDRRPGRRADGARGHDRLHGEHGRRHRRDQHHRQPQGRPRSCTTSCTSCMATASWSPTSSAWCAVRSTARRPSSTCCSCRGTRRCEPIAAGAEPSRHPTGAHVIGPHASSALMSAQDARGPSEPEKTGTGGAKPPPARRHGDPPDARPGGGRGRPCSRIRSAWLPSSTIRPWSNTRIRSSARTVDRRWAMTIVVRPSSAAASPPGSAPPISAVEARGRLVQDQDRRVGQEGAGDRHPLALAAGQLDAALADQGGVALRQARDEVVGVGEPRRRLDLRLRRAGPAVGDVLARAMRWNRTAPAARSPLRAQRSPASTAMSWPSIAMRPPSRS